VFFGLLVSWWGQELLAFGSPLLLPATATTVVVAAAATAAVAAMR